MPRLAFEEPKGGPLKKKAAGEPAEETEDDTSPAKHRREGERDTALLIMQGFTIVVAIALVGVIILLTTAGGEEPRAKSPAVPEIPESGTGPTTTSLAAMLAPEVRSQMTAFVKAAPTTTTTPVPTTGGPPVPPPPTNQFVRIGDRCDTRGAYAFTESFQPVVCDRGRGNRQLTWQPMFR